MYTIWCSLGRLKVMHAAAKEFYTEMKQKSNIWLCSMVAELKSIYNTNFGGKITLNEN